MSEMKLSLPDKRIAQFGESSTELLTDIHARNKDASNRERKMWKTISIPNTDIDLLDEEVSGL